MMSHLLRRWTWLLNTALIFAKVSFEEAATNLTDSRRPIWNVAHMANALYQISYYLDRGANSIEFDVTFNSDGEPRYTFHGIPCDCFRRCTRYEYFDTYMDHMRKMTTPGDPLFREELVLLFMDLKVRGLSERARIFAGENMAKKLLQDYWKHNSGSSGRAYVLLSLPSIEHIGVLRSFRRTLEIYNATSYESKVGYDFSGNENLNMIRSVLNSVGIKRNIWQGDGITNCLPRGTSRLLEALRERNDIAVGTRPNKVYWWTVDKYSTMRRTLSLGVDALITNYPQSLDEVLKEDAFVGEVRLATIDDNPWDTYAERSAKLITAIEARSGRNIELEDEEEILYNS